MRNLTRFEVRISHNLVLSLAKMYVKKLQITTCYFCNFNNYYMFNFNQISRILPLKLTLLILSAFRELSSSCTILDLP